MSEVIVAKALNDTLGTPEFEGLNTILDRQLDVFNEKFAATLDDFAAKMAGKAIRPSEKLYWDFETISVRANSTATSSEKIKFNASGVVSVAITCNVGANHTLTVSARINGESTELFSGHTGAEEKTIQRKLKVKKGDVVDFVVSVSGDYGESASIDICAEEYEFSSVILGDE